MMRSSWVKIFKQLLSLTFIGLSFVLLYLTIHKSGIKWHHLNLSTEKWIFLLAAILLVLIAIWLQSIRFSIPWKKTLAPFVPDSINGLYLSLLYNCILPGNLGEAVRAWHFSKKNKTAFTQALAAIFLEKYIDAFNFIVYGILLGFFFKGFHLYNHFMLPATIVVSIIFLFYLLVVFCSKMERWCLRWLNHLGAGGKWLWQLHCHLKLFLHGMDLTQYTHYIMLGFLIFATNIVQYFFILNISGVHGDMLALDVAFFIAMCMVFVFLIPSAPANLGVLHYGIFLALLEIAHYKNIPISPEIKTSFGVFAIYLHLSYVLPEVIIGSIVLLKERNVLFSISK